MTPFILFQQYCPPYLSYTPSLSESSRKSTYSLWRSLIRCSYSCSAISLSASALQQQSTLLQYFEGKYSAKQFIVQSMPAGSLRIITFGGN